MDDGFVVCVWCIGFEGIVKGHIVLRNPSTILYAHRMSRLQPEHVNSGLRPLYPRIRRDTELALQFRLQPSLDTYLHDTISLQLYL